MMKNDTYVKEYLGYIICSKLHEISVHALMEKNIPDGQIKNKSNFSAWSHNNYYYNDIISQKNDEASIHLSEEKFVTNKNLKKVYHRRGWSYYYYLYY